MHEQLSLVFSLDVPEPIQPFIRSLVNDIWRITSELPRDKQGYVIQRIRSILDDASTGGFN